jgi:hypothetical protein
MLARLCYAETDAGVVVLALLKLITVLPSEYRIYTLSRDRTAASAQLCWHAFSVFTLVEAYRSFP